MTEQIGVSVILLLYISICYSAKITDFRSQPRSTCTHEFRDAESGSGIEDIEEMFLTLGAMVEGSTQRKSSCFLSCCSS